ncbi:MAG: transglutaminase-like domain-containing protein [Candidatus Methylacidiphilales bacterium]|nr:transglutaminase-like domain-containing protein [Candidatus Methylacidiphilales bacterium]
MIRVVHRKAVESLLGDDDASTRELVIREIVAHRLEHEELVRDLAGSSYARIREAACQILSLWGCASPAAARPGPSEVPPLRTWKELEELCWLLARMEDPELDSGAYERTLANWAERVTQAAGPQPGPMRKIAALRRILADETGLHGNRADYYNPANNFLTRVIDTRLGIPLTLSLVYLFVAHRAGWEAYGLNTPGHYLAGLEGVVFDPYHGGSILTADCLAQRFGGSAEECSRPDYCRASPVDTAQRMLSNLLNSYLKIGDQARYRRINAYLKILQENAV